MRGIPIVCYTYKTQKEFRHNAKVIIKNKLGFKAKNFKLGFLLSKKILVTKNLLNLMKINVENLNGMVNLKLQNTYIKK